MTPMTEQEIFDRVARHLLTQGREAQDHNKINGAYVCRYKTADGLMCAIGCLIPPENYSEAMEGKRVMHNEVYSRLPKLAEEVRANLLVSLQAIHDGSFPIVWKRELEGLGKRLELDTKVLEEFPDA